MAFTGIEKRLEELMMKDKTHPTDIERKSLFFIIAGNDELWKLQDEIYNFKEHSIEPEILETGICSSSKTLIQIGYNLYNSYPTDNLLDCFSALDDHNFELAMKALHMRLERNGTY